MAHQHGSSGEAITIQRVRTLQVGRLRLASPGIGDDGRIDDLHSA
ncbi:MAG: hypothetical protein JWO72_777, partial [Caulobacteraceae bacterium]|nr:hypothetical protein [Caulobacteraceae bacterium]